MGRALVFGLFCVSFLVTLVSAKAFTGCLDGISCRSVQVIGQGRDVLEALQQHASALEINLSGNLLDDESFPVDSLRYVNQLHTLNLSYNLLQHDPFRNARVNKLNTIDLTYNDLIQVTVPAAVTRFLAVRNKLSYIRFQGTSLSELLLSKNHFENINHFSALNQLTTLDLSCNRIRELKTDVFSNMYRLSDLNLSYNHIHKTSGAGFPRNLQILDVSNNILTMFDEVFGRLPNVRKLYLQNNKIVMIVKVSEPYSKLQQIDVSGNEWNCNHLGDLQKAVRIHSASDAQQCAVKNLKNVCCSNSNYGDLLIEHYRNHYSALKVSSDHQKGEVSCSGYTPDPCHGDDTLVAKVAKSSVKSAALFAKSQLQQLEAKLQQTINIRKRDEGTLKEQQRQIYYLTGAIDDLSAFIGTEYSAVGLTGQKSVLDKLKDLFQKYEALNTDLKTQITKEELNNQDTLQEVTDLQTELEDMRIRQDKLTEELNKRNRTVTDYQLRISELSKRLGKDT